MTTATELAERIASEKSQYLGFRPGERDLVVAALRRSQCDVQTEGAATTNGTATLSSANCTCGGSHGQPADHHDISCPLAISSTNSPCEGK